MDNNIRSSISLSRLKAIRVYENANIFNPDAIRSGIKPLIDITDNLPDIVCCKDCKYYDSEYHICQLHSELPDQISTGFNLSMNEDDYCSYGELPDQN